MIAVINTFPSAL